MKLFILDNGHGGIVNRKYTTCPNYTNNPKTWHKMHIHYGKPIYEGVFNREVVKAIADMCIEEAIDFHVLVPEDEDISLTERVRRVNEIVKEEDVECILVSIHGNAFNSIAMGFEVFTTKGDTPADPIAEVFAEEMESKFPEKVMRWDLTDGYKDKEANFKILRETSCPAILTENFFFDSPVDARVMMSKEGINRIAEAHVKAMLRINQM